MTQLSIMDLAKQGDPHAIASLINRSLASKGIHAEAELEAECLKISLQASQIPNQKAVVTIIHRGMVVLQVKQIKRVKILTYRSDNHYLAWQDEIYFGNNDEPAQPIATPQIAKGNSDLGQNVNLVSNPKGVILVQKLSQIQQNLQEYQDIIVRFTDEQVGTVRCLTTLTELIQVISQPSFLFASVASNPNLRSLLDTIAESSKTDQHGDQVITNLSILQPGQQWQKAKIRLVTKIFLEPVELTQDQNEPEATHQGLTLDLEESNPESMADENPDIDLNNATSAENNKDNSEDITTNLGSESNSQVLTIDSLFDDLPDPALLSPQSTQIVNDITENSDFSDSLFDDFMNGDEGNSYRETESLSTYQVSERTKPTNADDDLFGNFSLNDGSVKSDLNTLENDIESIKSRIPKQNLDKFLQLMDEEEQIKSNSGIINLKKDIDKDDLQIKTDLGATTIERILANMDTITLSGSSSKSSSDFVTLEDFAGDMNSVGF
jgi:hypothetical protein